jgi:hypothetical protein
VKELPAPSPPHVCRNCGNLLVPPELASGMKVSANVLHRRRTVATLLADYVCLNCGRAYAWAGNPPTLKVLALVVADDSAEDDR